MFRSGAGESGKRIQSIQFVTSSAPIKRKFERWVASAIGAGVPSGIGPLCGTLVGVVRFRGFEIRVSDTARKLPATVGFDPNAIE